MGEQAAAGFPFGVGPAEDVLTEFGVSRQGFVQRFREILLKNPPVGLDHTDVATLLQLCRR